MIEEAPPAYVIDASALLAFLHEESGHEAIAAALRGSAISSVNWSEVVQKALTRGVDVDGLRSDLTSLGLEIEPFASEDAEDAALLWPKTRKLGLSLGDRASLALARRLHATILTADRAWKQLAIDVKIQVIR